MSSAESGLSNDLSALVLGVDGHCVIFCELLPTLSGYPDTAFRLLWSFFCSLESVHQNKLFAVVPGVAYSKKLLQLGCVDTWSHRCCPSFRRFEFSWITIAFLHCDLMRASLPFSAFCISSVFS